MIAVCAGTFDPITNGHLDVIERASKHFDKVIIAVAMSAGKNPIFTLDERTSLVEGSIITLSNVSVLPFDGMLVDFCHDVGADCIVKGLRVGSDFDYEIQMAGLNKKLAPDVETFFVMASPEYMHLSSSMVRELAAMGGKFCPFVPKNVAESLQKKFEIKTLDI